MQHHTRSQLEALPTHELIKLYNTVRLEGAPLVKRFSSREAGINQLLKALAARSTTSQKDAKVRTVLDGKNDGKSAKAGRPVTGFSVKLADHGKSEVRATSLRGQIIAYVKECGGVAKTADIEVKFGEPTRGAILKLIEVEWLSRV